MQKKEVLYPEKTVIEAEWLRPWEVLRSGDVERGLRLLGEYSERHPGPHTLIALGYLWTGQCETASARFRAAAHSKMTPNEDMFGYAGAAEWHLGNVPDAVNLWKEGMKAPYAAGGVCTRTRMLLLTSSILRPGSFPRSDAEAELRDAVERIRLKWVAALGRFLLGETDEKSLEPLWLSEACSQTPRVLPSAKMANRVLQCSAGGRSRRPERGFVSEKNAIYG